MKIILLIALGFSLLIASSCLRINIAPLDIDTTTIKTSDTANMAKLSVSFQGKDLDDAGWVKGLSISRLFFSSIENESGSLISLLSPPLKSLINKKGYQYFPHKPKDKSSASLDKHYLLNIHIKKKIFLWLPPVEFIQTPTPRRRGELRIDFLIETQYIKKTNAKDIILWSEKYQEKDRVPAFPGNEKQVIEIIAHRVLSNYLETIASKF